MGQYFDYKKFLTQYDDTQYDAQFFRALKQTTIQGPGNTFVHRAVAEIGLSSWQQLSKKGQLLVLMTIERGLVGKEAKKNRKYY
ncbi:hypothetical protein BGP_1767 [Beggiatoa sp. PS]|nr:hypothetical protein BGP_1767 [Beggiatoa sp. PS]